jgi:uncharacterized protein (TIRG00374 family)
MYSWALSLVTPGQLGDASIAIFLKKNGVPSRCSLTAYLLDKSISFGILLLLCWYGSGIILPEFIKTWFLVLPLIIVSFLAFSIRILQKKQFKIITFIRIKNWLIMCIKDLRLFCHHEGIVLLNIILTVIRWAIVSLIYFLTFFSFGTFVGWPEVGIIPLLATIVGYIPVSVGGIGTVEVTAVYLFGLFGVGKATVVSVYLVLRLLQYFIALVFILFSNYKNIYKSIFFNQD